MLLLKYNDIDKLDKFIETYKEKTTFLEFNELNTEVITMIEDIKTAINLYDIVIINYIQSLALCLDALNIEYNILYNIDNINDQDKLIINSLTCR